MLKFDAKHYAETTEALRKAEVTSENKRSDWGRETLTGLFGNHLTAGDLTAALLVAFKPKMNNGKPGTTLSSLRNAKGGDAVRKAAVLCLEIVEAASDGQIADAFRPIAIAFATDAPDAPKSLYALRDEMSRLRRDAAKEAAGVTEDGDEPEGEGETVVATVPLAVMAERMALAIREASAEDVLAADEQLSDLMNAVRDAYAATSADEEQLAA